MSSWQGSLFVLVALCVIAEALVTKVRVEVHGLGFLDTDHDSGPSRADMGPSRLEITLDSDHG